MIEKINALIKQAMIDKDDITKNILRLVKGEIEREYNKAKDNKQEFSNIERENIIKKLIKSNQTTLKLYLEDCEETKDNKVIEKTDMLVKEINILKKLLLKSMDLKDLYYFIMTHNLDIKSCKSDGQAVGMIMKEAKKLNIPVEADIVKEYVKNEYNTKND